MISSNACLEEATVASPERGNALIQVEFRSETLSSLLTEFWSEFSELGVASALRVGKLYH